MKGTFSELWQTDYNPRFGFVLASSSVETVRVLGR